MSSLRVDKSFFGQAGIERGDGMSFGEDEMIAIRCELLGESTPRIS